MPILQGGKVIEGSEYRETYESAGAPTTQFNNIAVKGATCVDTTNGKLYINTGTKASNTWTVVGAQV